VGLRGMHRADIQGMVTVRLLAIGSFCPAIESLRCVVWDGNISARRNSSARISWRPLRHAMSPIGTFETYRPAVIKSAFEGRPESLATGKTDVNDPLSDIASGRLNAYYASFTFQKIGAPNFRMPRTFFRNTVGCTRSPQGTYVTSLRASF
jgi:hypothetical protein